MDKIKSTELIKKIKIVIFFIYLVFFYMFGGKSETVKYSEVILLLFLALEGLRIIKIKKIKYCIPIIITFIFAFYCFLSNFWAINSELAIEKSKTLFALAAFLLVSYNFFIDVENSEEYILKIIMYAGIMFSIYVILYYGVGEYINRLIAGERVGTEINNVNAIGLQTAISFIIAIFYGLFNNKKAYFLISIIPLIVSLGTGSRKVLLLIIIGSILLFILKRDKKIKIKEIGKKVLLFGILLIVFIYILQMPMFSMISNRFFSMTNILIEKGKIDNSTEERELYIKGGFDQFLKKPMFGIGVANSCYITSDIIPGTYTYLHNNYIELLACVGIIGFVLYYSVYFYIIYFCIKNFKKNSKSLNIVLIIFIMNLILEYGLVSYYSKSTYIYILLGLLVIENEKRKDKNEENRKIIQKSQVSDNIPNE